MRADELDFNLPEELIAQTPSADRAQSRLLHYRDGSIAHRQFSDLPRRLKKGDLLVFNDTRVLPARFYLRKPTGGRIEALFLRHGKENKRWLVMLKGLGRYKGGLYFEAAQNIQVQCVGFSNGQYEIEVDTDEPAESLLARLGRMPLPPYIHRDASGDPRDAMDRDRYQTVYAAHPGSAAAPTAGLHFTPEILAELDSIGVQLVAVTLHVGLGTFQPISADSLEGHVMHSEEYEVSGETAEALNRAESERRRIVAVGTTSARVLESHPADAKWEAQRSQTSIFIYPPYQWKRVGALITNFHLPRSTLIALVGAFVGMETQRRVYAEAIANRYRFFSYGDAMLAER